MSDPHVLEHEYKSTACLHGLCPAGTDDQSKWTCLQQCKYCPDPNLCVCSCHGQRGHLPMSATSRAIADIRSERLAHQRDAEWPQIDYLGDVQADPGDPGRRQYLVRAAAILVAEIEELDGQ